jgi:hypothetical protein
VLTPALAGPTLGGAAGAVFGVLCGLAYALLSVQQKPLVFCPPSMALAGAGAGLLLELYRTFECHREWEMQLHDGPPDRWATAVGNRSPSLPWADRLPPPDNRFVPRTSGKADPRF